MTENEAKSLLIHVFNTYGAMISENFKDDCISETFDMAIKALEEIQQYRAIGTAEEIEPYVRLAEKLNLCDLVRENARLENKIRFLKIFENKLKEYEEIGTVEECLCPTCRTFLGDDQDWYYNQTKYCGNCGQKLEEY